MPVHIHRMTSDVTVIEGELPLDEQQIEKLVQIICERLEWKQREAKQSRAATTIRSQAAPPLRVEE
jgi:hypothetical protein